MTALLPTLPGFTHGIIGFHGTTVTVQCDRCGETRTDAPIRVFAWAGLPDGHNERLCRDCRHACGCPGCEALT